jgi:hypothetical protein
MNLNKTHDKVCIGKNPFDTFPIQNGLKEVDALLPCLFNFASVHVIRKVQEYQKEMEHISFWHMFKMSLCWMKNINTINKSTEALLEASREFGIEVNAEKTKYMFMSVHQSAGQNHNLLIYNKSFENVGKFK